MADMATLARNTKEEPQKVGGEEEEVVGLAEQEEAILVAIVEEEEEEAHLSVAASPLLLLTLFQALLAHLTAKLPLPTCSMLSINKALLLVACPARPLRT